MSSKIVGFFDGSDSAHQAIEDLRHSGFDSNDISLVSKHNESDDSESGFGVEDTLDNQNLWDGTLTGGAIGGLAALGIGASTLIAGPLGIGAFLAAGPLGSLLAGAVGGGLLGGLVDYGIPEEDSREYESRVESGEEMVIMQVDENRVEEAGEILRNSGAHGVKAH